MEWLLDDGNSSKTVTGIENITTVVRNVMEDKCDFIVLSPSSPVKYCNFMQAVSIGDNSMHVEVSILQPTGKDHIYSRECRTEVAISFFVLFYMEDMVPDVKDWTFEAEC